MSSFTKLTLSIFVFVSLQVFGINILNPNTNIYISGEYEEKGVEINYSAIINITTLSDNNTKKKLAMQLSSFAIEDANYKGVTYRDNELFGTSFPIDTAVEITTDIQLFYGTKSINKTVVLNPSKKTIIDLGTNQLNIFDLKIQNQKTILIKQLFEHEVFIDTIKANIDNLNENKSPEILKEEYTRLMILGSSYLNENNYKKASSTYLDAKKFTTNTSHVDAQINTTIKYAAKDNIIIDTKESPISTTRTNITSSKANTPTTTNGSSSPKIANTKKFKEKNIEYIKDEDGVEYEYEYTPDPKNELVFAVNSDDSNIEYEYEYEYESNSQPKKETGFSENSANSDTEYEYEYEYEGNQPNKQSNNTASKNSDVEYEYEYENGDIKTFNEDSSKNSGIKKSSNLVSNTTYKNKTGNSSLDKKSSITRVSSKINSSKEEVKRVQKPLDKNYELIKTTKGYIKYKKDEQAVVDKDGNILIPYRKHEIVRFKAGFAQVRLKDDVQIKNIACTNKNEEYVWSARIYENPWIETVIDKKGNYVKDLEKKVEIYIVDNINYRPSHELSNTLIESYKDPNPFRGTQQISAFNLWNRDNGNKVSVVKKRMEIERLKKISKDNAYVGIDKCRDEISKHFQEVKDYYSKMGYEIILKK